MKSSERGADMEYTIGQFYSRLQHAVLFRRSSLRGRMTISYMAVTIGSVLTFVLLFGVSSGLLTFVLADSVPSSFLVEAQQQAQLYALSAAVQAQGTTLDMRTNFVPGHSYSLTSNLQDVPNGIYISGRSVNPANTTIALLVAPDGYVVASSYPAYYPALLPISALTSEETLPIEQALAGNDETGTTHLFSSRQAYAATPVWSKDHRPIGALYLLMPVPNRTSIIAGLRSVVLINLFLLIVVTPIGVFFGWISTRGLVRRVQRLVVATTQFAAGDYTQRVASTSGDEIGHLEQQFNQMAEQLIENIAHRQQLAEQNARLEERSRISRELHDAISQDLFSLRMLADGLQEATHSGSPSADLRPHIAMLEQTTSSMTREMRTLLLELRPSQLEHLGLCGALQNLAHTYSVRLGITVTTDIRPVQINVKGEHALLRIAQEALANAARHSSASLISLSLSRWGNMLRLTIVDNGQGFCQQTEDARHGLGLHLMRERVEELHGTFDLQTAPGEGTRITVCLPLEGADD